MKEDKILEMFFAPERWQYAIAKGVVKDISKGVLYKLTKPERAHSCISASVTASTR